MTTLENIKEVSGAHILPEHDGSVVLAVVIRVHEAVVVHDLPLDLAFVHRDALLELSQQLGLAQLMGRACKTAAATQ